MLRGGPVLALAVTAALAAPAAALAVPAAAQYLYERTLMSAADVRCHLFAPAVGRSLSAARMQAHDAALRAGETPDGVAALEARAQAKAAATPCNAPGLKLAAERLRTAYADYAKLQTLTFPGVRTSWKAERPYPAYHGPPRWGLVQTTVGQGGWMLFGVVNGQVALLDARRNVAPAASVRLVLRDPARLDQPYVDARRNDPAAQMPPLDVSQVFIARSRAPAPKSLWPAGAQNAVTYQFPAEALPALARLDPREMAAVELVYPSLKGDRVATSWIEVGDLAAARAFLDAR